MPTDRGHDVQADLDVGRRYADQVESTADAKHGEVDKDTLIPGTLHGKVVGTEDPLSLLTDGNSHK